MITTTVQLAISLAHCLRFSKAIRVHDMKERPANIHPLLWQAERDAMTSQLKEIHDEISDFVNRIIKGEVNAQRP